MMKVYGSRVSYYTGKLEAYLRYRGVEYTRVPMPYNDQERIKRGAGAVQHPVIERDDGRWMSDTTPILLEFERELGPAPILPASPVVAFIARLIEDYADEWLWRSAMHYRWSYSLSRNLLGEILAEELHGNGPPLPKFILNRIIKRRQRLHFVRRDGVTDATWDHVEQGYFNALDGMGAMLAERPFLLGDAPSLADFGLMAPMFRHFSMDPVPEEIMRNRAPAVYEWVARMWNARATSEPQFLDTVPEDAAALLKEACETHLVQLAENARAYGAGANNFAMTVQGYGYSNLPVSRYRVWCLEQLREHFAALENADQGAVKALLPFEGADIMWREVDIAASDYDTDRQLPYGKAINVYGEGTPP